MASPVDSKSARWSEVFIGIQEILDPTREIAYFQMKTNTIYHLVQLYKPRLSTNLVQVGTLELIHIKTVSYLGINKWLSIAAITHT